MIRFFSANLQRIFVVTIVFSALGMALVSYTSSTPKPKLGVSYKQPDILFFLADDMTSVDCEPYGNPDVKTPNLSKLAQQGVLFDNMYNASAICCPTRQSLYTGLYPVKNGGYPNHSKVYMAIIL